MTTFTGTYSAGIVLNPTTVQNPVTIGSTAVVLDFYGGDSVYGNSPTAWTVTNLGSVSATGLNSAGIHLTAGGTIDNAAGTAFINGYTDGVLIGGTAGTVSNLGTIAGGNGDGVDLQAGGTVSNATANALISGYAHGVRIGAAVGAVTNYGTIRNSGASAAVYLGGGGAIDNAAATALIAADVGVGIEIANAAATVVNSGTIAGLGAPSRSAATRN